MEKLKNQMIEDNVRCEKIFHLGIMTAQDRLPDDLKEAFDSDWAQIHKTLKLRYKVDIDADEWQMVEALEVDQKNGFLVQFATPCPRFFDSDSFSFSWGFYTCKWFYAETMEEVTQKGIKWARGYINKKRKEFKKQSNLEA